MKFVIGLLHDGLTIDTFRECPRPQKIIHYNGNVGRDTLRKEIELLDQEIEHLMALHGKS